MYIRKQLDIGWRDLAYGFWSSLTCRHSRAISLEQNCSKNGDILATLSVRSSFDLLLGALALPPGSEILVSAITIRDMVHIIERHGLIAVPIDLDMESLTPRLDLLKQAITPQSRAILIAHLFGSRMELDSIVAFAKQHNLMVWEDCAQAYRGGGYLGHAEVDVSMFSFGPIKTATALGGGLIKVKDRAVLDRMRQHQQCYPRQPLRNYLYKLLKYSLIKFAAQPLLYQLLIGGIQRLGLDYDLLINSLAREFAGYELFSRIRQQPCLPLLALLERRMATDHSPRLQARAEAGRQVAHLLKNLIEQPGIEASEHSYWLFPIVSQQADQLIKQLRQAGFDATQGTSNLYVVPAPAGREYLEPIMARRAIDQIIYLPVYAELPASARQRLIETLVEWSSAQLPNLITDEVTGTLC